MIIGLLVRSPEFEDAYLVVVILLSANLKLLCEVKVVALIHLTCEEIESLRDDCDRCGAISASTDYISLLLWRVESLTLLLVQIVLLVLAH